MTKIGAELNKDYVLKELEDNMYFPGRGATVILENKPIGTIGVLHPEVLESFGLKNPVSVFEVDFEPVW
jgi:phenylalanyl-tRNA synthetase beta chain